MSFSSPLNCHGGFSRAVVYMEGLLPSHFFFFIQTTVIDYSNSKCQEETCLPSLLGQHSQTHYCWKGPCPVIHGPLMLITPLACLLTVTQVSIHPGGQDPDFLGPLLVLLSAMKATCVLAQWSHCSSVEILLFSEFQAWPEGRRNKRKVYSSMKGSLRVSV